MKARHWRVIRGAHAYMACEPQIRMSGYLRIAWATGPNDITCQACREELARMTEAEASPHA